MRRFSNVVAALLVVDIIALLLMLTAYPLEQPQPETFSPIQSDLPGPVGFVDPLIGTAPSTLVNTTDGAPSTSCLVDIIVDQIISVFNTKQDQGQVYPATGVPFGMTQWTPQTRSTEKKCVAPYYYNDNHIEGFRASHWLSGSCTQDYGSFTVSASTGTIQAEAKKVRSRYSHDEEFSSPAYYAVDLLDYGIQAEITGTSRAGMLRFTVERPDTTVHLIFRPNSDEGEGYIEVRPEQQQASGYNPVHRIYQSSGESAGFSGHFVADYNLLPIAHGVIQNRDIHPNATAAKGLGAGEQVGAWVSFVMSPSDILLVRAGTSFTSDDQARYNLDAEIPDWEFGALTAASETKWNNFLGKVAVVEDGDSMHKAQFYTALYHSALLPRTFSDADGAYPSFAGGKSMQNADEYSDYYADFSMWDTFRGLHPLLTILEPERSADMMRSLVDKAEQGGWLPIYPSWNHYTQAMIGDHVAVTLTDAARKGIGMRKDWERAYAMMRKNAFESPATPEEYKDGKGRRALHSYLQYGYIPLEDPVKNAYHEGEQVSRTLEYAFDDYAVAQMALLLGKTEDHAALMKRATNYQNVFDKESGLVRGRYADGRWIAPFRPTLKQPYITEGSPWQYTWFVPHDPLGLVELMGGPEAFIAQLDQLFDEGLYWHGNEPGHHSAYLYAYVGAPWKTQQRVHDIVTSEYGPGPGGLSGNDDSGQMSAWYVLSSIGIYPVCPGQPVYIIGSPHFATTRLSLAGNKTFLIRANGVSSKAFYIQSATLNGQNFDQAWITHETLMEGGELVFEMGDTPNISWGAVDLPPNEML